MSQALSFKKKRGRKTKHYIPDLLINFSFNFKSNQIKSNFEFFFLLRPLSV